MTPHKRPEKIDHDYYNYNCKDGDEVTDEDVAHAAAAIGSINGVSERKSFEIISVWMVLFVSMNSQHQQRDF